MATVKKKCVVAEYTLTLNAEEAQVLRAILAMIGGDSTRYPRRVSENISDALDEAGVEKAVLPTEDRRSCIYFT